MFLISVNFKNTDFLSFPKPIFKVWFEENSAALVTLTTVLLRAAEVIFIVSVRVSGGAGITAHWAFPLSLQHAGLSDTNPEETHLYLGHAMVPHGPSTFIKYL